MNDAHLSTTTRDEREIIDFAAIWLPYGGPEPPDIFVRFGISAAIFHRRLQAVLTKHTSTQVGISPELHRRLRLCAERNQTRPARKNHTSGT